jgi:hypothetical protein
MLVDDDVQTIGKRALDVPYLHGEEDSKFKVQSAKCKDTDNENFQLATSL